MTYLQKWEKVIFGAAALVIAAVSAVGFYLIQGEPAIKQLVVTGHNHTLSFAYGAILFGLLLRHVAISERRKLVLAWWMSTTYLGPIALMVAGMLGRTDFLMFTSPVFEGSFVVLWGILFYELIKKSQ